MNKTCYSEDTCSMCSVVKSYLSKSKDVITLVKVKVSSKKSDSIRYIMYLSIKSTNKSKLYIYMYLVYTKGLTNCGLAGYRIRYTIIPDINYTLALMQHEICQ